MSGYSQYEYYGVGWPQGGGAGGSEILTLRGDIISGFENLEGKRRPPNKLCITMLSAAYLGTNIITSITNIQF